MDGSADPLFDTLFRPTTAPVAPAAAPPSAESVADPAAVASAAPVRVTGTRTRAGNAMNRTRAALLAGAARAVAASGTRIAMAQVATAAGVAKATLYNHFRTRDAVLAALVLDQVQRLVDAQADQPLDDALAATAIAISRNEVARGLAQVEPAALAAIARIDDESPAWQLARHTVQERLVASGRGGADMVLRWLASFLLSPGRAETIAADVAVLLAGLPVTPAAPATVAPAAGPGPAAGPVTVAAERTA